MDTKARWATLDRWVLRDMPGKMGVTERLARPVHKALRVPPVPPEKTDMKDHRVQLV
jgi:hypothetical protein